MSWVVVRETMDGGIPSGMPLEPPEEPYAIIPLHGKYGVGNVAKISIEDVSSVRRYRWYVTPNGYVYSYGNWQGPKAMRIIRLHRFVLGLADDDKRIGDHRFGDKLDNRRSMLRACTHQDNTRNRRAQSRNRTNSKGVIFDGGAWSASIMADGKLYVLGKYPTQVEAAQAYDKAARFHFGEFARTNYPGTEAESAEAIRGRYTTALRSSYKSAYIGVTFRGISDKTKGSIWRARIGEGFDRYLLGEYDNEEKAAQAYDAAARYLFGPDTETNFSGTEARSPQDIWTEYSKGIRTSQYRGVGIHNGRYQVKISPHGKKGRQYSAGYYTCEKEAARAYDAMARHFWGDKAKTNFPGTEALSPERVRAARKPLSFHPNKASKFYGVSWHKESRKWYAILKRKHLGSFASELDAARAVDDARVAAGLPRINFPDEVT